MTPTIPVHAGYDFLLIDQQHSAIDPEKLRYLLTAAQAAGSKTIVRVGSAYDRVGIQQALDMGSDGILIPCSRTAADGEPRLPSPPSTAPLPLPPLPPAPPPPTHPFPPPHLSPVKNAISCSKYPVTGPGSEGGTRSVYVNLRPQFPGGFPALFDYVQHRGNAETIIAAQIETKDALDNIEEICALDGLDIAFIGPGDLCTDMGLVKK